MRKRDTRQELILAAERLFAERGIEGVSLREINLAAKQRNTSAAHYHFGSKDALVDAIFEFRRSEIGKRREQRLDALEAGRGSSGARGLAEALIMPLADEIPHDAEGSRYLEFLAQLYLTSPIQARDILRKHEAANTRWMALATETLPEVPRWIMATRLHLMGRHVVVSLSVYLRRGLGMEGVGFEVYLSDMIDAVAGYFAAPPSASTLRALARAKDERQLESERAAAPAAAPKSE